MAPGTFHIVHSVNGWTWKESCLQKQEGPFAKGLWEFKREAKEEQEVLNQRKLLSQHILQYK